MDGYRYEFTPEDIVVATEFAKARSHRDRVHYATRGSAKRKVTADFANGALGEIAAWHALTNMFGNRASVGAPDFSIHTMRCKSYDPDLHLSFEEGVPDVRAQVKMHVCYRYGHDVPPSFMFQKPGTGPHEDKHLAQIVPQGHSNDWLVGVLGFVTDPDKVSHNRVKSDAVADFAVVTGPFLMQDIVDRDLWRRPSHRSLQARGTKKQCVWLSDLTAHTRRVAGMAENKDPAT